MSRRISLGGERVLYLRPGVVQLLDDAAADFTADPFTSLDGLNSRFDLFNAQTAVRCDFGNSYILRSHGQCRQKAGDH